MASSGRGPPAAATNVPLVDWRSSAYQWSASRVSCRWRRETPESEPQSMSGWMFRLVEARPTRTLALARGTTLGMPAAGHGSVAPGDASWPYQSGSTHTSATHSMGAAWAGAPAGGVSGAETAGGVTAAAGGGICPVVKSYPQLSQNRAAPRFGSAQFGQTFSAALGATSDGGVSDPVAGAAAAGAAGTAGAAGAIGAIGSADVAVVARGRAVA